MAASADISEPETSEPTQEQREGIPIDIYIFDDYGNRITGIQSRKLQNINHDTRNSDDSVRFSDHLYRRGRPTYRWAELLKFIEYIDDARDMNVLCVKYRGENDIQIGMTETRKQGETSDIGLQRGLREEIGMRLTHHPVMISKYRDKHTTYAIRTTELTTLSGSSVVEHNDVPDSYHKVFMFVYGTSKQMSHLIQRIRWRDDSPDKLGIDGLVMLPIRSIIYLLKQTETIPETL